MNMKHWTDSVFVQTLSCYYYYYYYYWLLIEIE